MLRMKDRRVRLRQVSWSPDLKVWRNWLKPGVSWLRLVTGGVSRSWVIQLATFAKFATSLARRQGVRGLVLYLKTCQVLLMQNLPGTLAKHQPRLISKVAVARSADGLPRCIPRFAREQIRRGNVMTLRLWLTFFGIYRILKFAGVLKTQTITEAQPPMSLKFRAEWLAFIWKRFLPGVFEFTGWPMRGLAASKVLSRPEPLTILSASADSTKVEITSSDGETRYVYDSSFASRFNSAKHWVSGSWGWDLWVYLSFLTGGVGTTKSLWTKMEETAERGSFWSGVPAAQRPKDACDRGWTRNGRLACLPEPAGKIRVVALVDYWSQAALKPLHDWLFEVLREIPNDGTFDQLAPIKDLLSRIKDDTVVYSYDLSAATDCLSIKAQMLLLVAVFGPKFSVAWKRLLVNRTYWLWDGKSKANGGYVPLRYAQGQPMGAYSSWGMLAFTHHAMVQFAAYKANVKGWFDLYAVLGDDVVIADGRVAREYTKVCKELGVSIGLAKSVISRRKTLEFAKRFFRNGEDVSGLPMAFWAAAQHTMGVAHSLSAWYPSGTLANFIRALGGGFKSASSAGAVWGVIPRRVKALCVFLTHPLGGGKFAFKTWPEWLWSQGPMLQGMETYSGMLTSLTPYVTALLEEVVEPARRLADGIMKDIFFCETVGDAGSAAANTRSNRALSEALNSLTSAEKALKHFQRLNIKFLLHQISAVITQVTRAIGKIELVPSPSVRAMVKHNPEQDIVNVADLFRYWTKLRSRVVKDAHQKAGVKKISV
jgi:hypothetical protein